MNDLSPTPALPVQLSVETVVLRCFDALSRGDAVAEGVTAMWSGCVSAPAELDMALIAGAQRLRLPAADLFAFVVLALVETNPEVARAIAACQHGEGAARPTADTLSRAAVALGLKASAVTLLKGPLATRGILRALSRTAPLAVTPLALTAPLLWALGLPNDTGLAAMPNPDAPAPASYLSQAAQLTQTAQNRCIVLRGGTFADQTVWVEAACLQLGGQAVLLPKSSADQMRDAECSQGLGAALTLTQSVPVEQQSGAPGQREALRPLDGFDGTRVVLAGQDGGVLAPGWAVVDVSLPQISDAETLQTWRVLAPETKNCAALPRVGPGRLAAIAARSSAASSGLGLREAAGAEARFDIEPHGRLVADVVGDAAMITAPQVQAELELLAFRCQNRGGSGVRALLAGPSGSGKTMACSWLATRLDQPLFKVDLASIVSKYIGETEENLARILDSAEAADVILLFDEADSLFGARTEAKDSADRYANSQTNYLLSRIETHRGITVLTTNGMQRMDSAFARRLDQMIEVPLPDARQRLTLWQAYLGADTMLEPAQFKRLARLAEIAGGHIRAIAQTAHLMGAQQKRPVHMGDVVRALGLAYRGMGRTPPEFGGGFERFAGLESAGST